MKTGFKLALALLLATGCLHLIYPRDEGPYGIPRHMPGDRSESDGNEHDQTGDVDLAADAGSQATK